MNDAVAQALEDIGNGFMQLAVALRASEEAPASKAKAKAKAKPEPEPEPEPEQQADPEPEPEQQTEELTIAVVRKLAKQLMDEQGSNALKEMLEQFDAPSLGKLDERAYGAFAEAVNEALS